MSDSSNSFNTQIAERIEEAKAILRDLGLPPAQQNERSALTLLALLALKSNLPWSEASNPRLGITPIMNFIADNYDRTYAPNTRETIRRQTVHQFIEAGILVLNPDKPSRPTNSPKTVYQAEANTLKLIRTYQTNKWSERLRAYLIYRDALKKLGVSVSTHGKMPDVVVHHVKKDWLVLIEAVTSHGPVNVKRRNELQSLFANSTAGLVFVTAFLNRRNMLRYLNGISWETEVWIAESPTHMIHFDGERFLGPY